MHGRYPLLLAAVVSAFVPVDGRITGAGKIAIWTKADSLTHFAALAIEALP